MDIISILLKNPRVNKPVIILHWWFFKYFVGNILNFPGKNSYFKSTQKSIKVIKYKQLTLIKY